MEFLSMNTTCETVMWTTFISGILTFIASLLYLKWMNVDDIHPISKDLPSEYIEIPESLQHFQKLTHAFHTLIESDSLPDWCKKEQIDTDQLIENVLYWMDKHNHPNHYDVYVVIKLLHTSRDELINTHIYQQANYWFTNAMFIWSIAPQRILASWPYPDDESDDTDKDEKVDKKSEDSHKNGIISDIEKK